MLNAEEQGQIIKANNEAFEELALRWREPKTGETESDLRKAVLRLCASTSMPPAAAALETSTITSFLVYRIWHWRGTQEIQSS
jgi:hypothetical protein